MPVVVMIGYARSGGTLLARCLASLPGVMLFSEVNPRRRPRAGGRPYMLKDQARAWHGLELRSSDFAACVDELNAHAVKAGRSLVIRDWPVIDFVPMRENDFTATGQFSILESLSARQDVRAFGFIRDAYDVWVSNGCHADFFLHYRPYLERLFAAGIPIYRYEELCQDSDRMLRRLCADMGLSFDASYQSFANVQQVTGDVDLVSGSRGARHARIVNLPRARIPAAQVRWLEANADARAANALAGYPLHYASRPMENRWLAMAARLRASWRIAS